MIIDNFNHDHRLTKVKRNYIWWLMINYSVIVSSNHDYDYRLLKKMLSRK